MPIDFTRDFTNAPTTVFWDVEDFPLPEGRDLHWFHQNIKETLRKRGYCGDVSIKAYGEEKPEEEVLRYTDAGITFVPKGPKYWRLSYMLSDIGFWKLNHPDPSYNPTSLMVISKNVMSKRTLFVSLLEDLGYSAINVLLVVPDDYLPELGPVPRMISSAWYWQMLLHGELPMSRTDLKNLTKQTASYGYDIDQAITFW